MAGLTGSAVQDSYKSLLRVNDDTNGIDSSLEVIEDGEGTDSPIKVSTTNVTVLDHQVNTQYAYFGVASGLSPTYVADTHYPLPFSGNNNSAGLQDNLTFGTSTDPATSFTTADGSSTDASLIVPLMWFLPDAITIDSVTSLEGLEASSTLTTRMHLFSYTFTSGSTSALSSGTLLAHNSDVTNAGSEQAYKSTWTIDSASVAADKVILAFFRMDSSADNPSVSVTVKYHLG